MRSFRRNHSIAGTANRRGFVLAMVLVLTTVAAISLAGLARRSLNIAREAARAEEDIQRKWGQLSIERMLLPDADDLIENQVISQSQPSWPHPKQCVSSIYLGKLQFEVLLSDEDAKVNLNTIHKKTPQRLHEVCHALLEETAAELSRLDFKLPKQQSENAGVGAFQSWGQVFDLVDRDEQKLAREVLNSTQQVTIWGSGRLNIRRASDSAVSTLCQGQVSEETLRKLLTERAQNSVHSLEELLKRLTLRNKDHIVLRQLLTDESQCHTMWLSVASERREWITLVVSRPGGATGANRVAFTW